MQKMLKYAMFYMYVTSLHLDSHVF